MVESLRHEVAPLGINTHLIEPGRFRTAFLSSDKRKSKRWNIAEYADTSQRMLEGIGKEDGNQPGNPELLVEAVADLVRREGKFKDVADVPFRIPFGSDAFTEMKAKCEETLAMLQAWQSVIKSTDFGSV